VRSATLVSALLMSTAFTAPAFAQIETVIVTTERKAEDIQTVPVAVTALTATDLKAKQVNSFKDLQFHVPSVTFTKSNFGGAQFQIRGITTQFGLGAAIAQNENDVYQEAPALVNGQYYDVDQVAVSRGPQSTAYGRAATGGAVNIITSKPNLTEFQARASFDYGTYNTMKPEVMVNIPLIDNDRVTRVAALGVFHDGYENDNRVRGDKQLCHRDPSGVIGCLPDQVGFEPINVLSTLGATLGSKQGITALLNLSFGVPFATSQALGNTLGLFQLAGNGGPGDPAGPAGAAFLGVALFPNPFSSAAPLPSPPFPPGLFPMHPALVNGPGSGAGGTVTPDILTSNTAFSPKYKGNGTNIMLNWAQTITSWLKATVDAGYNDGYQFTQQNYNDASPENISAEIGPAVAGFHALFDAGANSSGAYNTYFTTA